VYDYLGRRVEKKVSTHNGTSWSVDDRRRFVWSDWLPLLELDASDPNDVTILRKYTWGLDLSGNSIDGAGGIGGLLATEDVADTKDYYYLYDASGNVGQVLDASDGSIAAKYEYDPYGNNLLDPNDPNESGPYAADNPFRFSTKYWDDETGLGYWGYRYYIPRLGRWINRDPIGDAGGLHLYCYGDNTPALMTDPLGLWPPGSVPPGALPPPPAPAKPKESPWGLDCSYLWEPPDAIKLVTAGASVDRVVYDRGVLDEVRQRPWRPWPPDFGWTPYGPPPVGLVELWGTLTAEYDVDGGLCCQCDVKTPIGTGSLCWGGYVKGHVNVVVPFYTRINVTFEIGVLVLPGGKIGRLLKLAKTARNLQIGVGGIVDAMGGDARLKDAISKAACAGLLFGVTGGEATITLPEIRRDNVLSLIGISP